MPQILNKLLFMRFMRNKIVAFNNWLYICFLLTKESAFMIKFYFSILSIILLTSCAEQYNIVGNSNVPSLDGRMLYIKVLNDGNLCSIDSCEVVHGKFNFMGAMDSIVMAELYMDNQSVMPFVIENSNLSIKVNHIEQDVTGGPLNDKLYQYLKRKMQLENEFVELSHRHMQLLIHGFDTDNQRAQIKRRIDKISNRIESLETNFIMKNYKNVLGPTVFMFICNEYKYPILTDQIKYIISKAPKEFLSNPFIEEYIKTAKLNMQQLNSRQHIRVKTHSKTEIIKY